MIQEPNYNSDISGTLGLKVSSVQCVLELIASGATVPFIARYRKEQTGGLDEIQLRDILEQRTFLENMYKARKTAIQGITDAGKMTPELMKHILGATSLKEVEEIYKPYKSKKKTLAMLAIEKGFQEVADIIKTNINPVIPAHLLKLYEKEEILEGAIDIIAAEITISGDLRGGLREDLTRYGIIESNIKTKKSLEKLNEKDTTQISKFDLYTSFSQKISHLKPYQILALNRGEKLGILNIKIEKSEKSYNIILREYAHILGIYLPAIELLEKAFKKGYDALFKSVENEIRSSLTELGENDAIETFQKNLGQLLLTKPEYGKNILAIDPGFRAGCKICVLDSVGNPVLFGKFFLSQPELAEKSVAEIIQKYNIDVIVCGNGTGVKEATTLIKEITQKDIYIINESGASVYSTSVLAGKEYPELDSLDRGTLSIGRRFIDPLSELVKIPVGSIGVGMYQHDISEKKLEEKLGYVVEDTVNEVGININTASVHVLEHISGITKAAAKKIYKNRPYTSRAELKKQLTPKAYELAVGFLRVPESKELLDKTDIHPDQYALARYMQHQHIPSLKSEESTGEVGNIFKKYTAEILEHYPTANEETLLFIIQSLREAGKEKRINSTHQKVSRMTNAEFKVGDIVPGIIRNVVAFGAFVDIGMKQDGLVHISQVADRFIADPREILEIGQTVNVKISSIDEKTGKIQLSIKEALTL